MEAQVHVTLLKSLPPSYKMELEQPSWTMKQPTPMTEQDKGSCVLKSMGPPEKP